MILYGRNMSPFVRRVAVWMTLQERAFERREVSVAEHFDQVAAVNPVARVPALTLDDGTTLIETWAICDWLDMTAPDRALIPAAGPARTAAHQAIALASGAADKMVTLVYEKNRRDPAFQVPAVIAKTETQIAGALAALDALIPEADWLGGAKPNGADIAAVCAHDFAAFVNPHLLGPGYPRLAALAGRANALPAFAATRP